MEIEEFQNIVNMPDITNVTVLRKREKFNNEIYNDIRNKNFEDFYNEYSKDVKLFNGYILVGVDGCDFEIPNTPITREKFDSTKDNISVPRALISNYFDVLNHYVLSIVIDKETASEKKLDE